MIQIKYSFRVCSSVLLIYTRRIQCTVHSIPISQLHSAGHLIKLVREICQNQIRSYLRLVFNCALVVFGTGCYKNYYLCLFYFIGCLRGLVSLVI